jgi:hypothetical protein
LSEVTIEENYGYYFESGCIGSIDIFDPCTGEASEFVSENVVGPIYSSIADINMNLLVQVGTQGLSIYSLAYTPGVAQDDEWLENGWFNENCNADACAPSKSLFADIVAGVALVIAIAAFPELIPGAVTPYILGVAGIAAATAGFCVTMPPEPGPTTAPMANEGRLLIE